MPSITIQADAILFDMDGTLIDSTPGVIGAWEVFQQAYPSIDVTKILTTSHGIRTIDNLRIHCGIEDPVILEQETARFERAILTSSKEDGRSGIVKLPGAAAVLDVLASGRHLPDACWAICTSATKIYASSALEVTGVPVPDVLVTADDVQYGKPYPDPYLLGAQKLGVKPENCVVFEDAPSGVRSGVAAGCTTIALLTTHPQTELENCKPSYTIKDLSRFAITLQL
ncbi:hypothetical protein AX16_001068 [Volvariella volvacea WC 439]|nr:hypothetical protein AX16_001068 [Volvariella volvacea WC 439]